MDERDEQRKRLWRQMGVPLDEQPNPPRENTLAGFIVGAACAWIVAMFFEAMGWSLLF